MYLYSVGSKLIRYGSVYFSIANLLLSINLRVTSAECYNLGDIGIVGYVSTECYYLDAWRILTGDSSYGNNLAS